MKKELVEVVFDRRKNSEKRGYGFLEVQVYLGRATRKYIMIGKYSPDDWQAAAASPETQALVAKCKKIIAAMDVLDEERTYDNFMYHFNGEEKKPKVEVKEEKSKEPEKSEKNFLDFMEEALANEDLREGTRKHKICAIETVRTFGKLNTYGDLTPKNIIAFDNWLHDGTRTDVTCYGYHKKIHKWVRQLYQMGEIPQDPYQVVTLKRGKCREREPLTELELKLMRSYKFEGKLDRVRDLFIFAAYTGLSFCDTQTFDFESMTKKEGKMYYIDGSRIKTDTKFFTPILSPAMKVLEKYDYQLPKISNQKANDYLHVIQMELHFRQKLTFHVARHSFATMALAHDVPIENVARMLGHQDIKTTQIYAQGAAHHHRAPCHSPAAFNQLRHDRIFPLVTATFPTHGRWQLFFRIYTSAHVCRTMHED
jgi:integrase/recombinase XerD